MLAYGYTVHSNNIQKVGEVPTVRLNYDILPIVVQFSEKSSSFYHFLTQVYTCTWIVCACESLSLSLSPVSYTHLRAHET